MCRPNGPRRAFFLTINYLDMKRPVILTLLLSLAILMPSLAQKDHSQQAEKRYGMYAIAFYNQENLFDTIDDPLIHDEDFLPGSSYGWNGMKYRRKVRNMSTTLASIGVDKGLKYGAAVIGLAEVENRNVVVDLTKSDALRERGYRVLHFDSPDARGIDCAMLYNPRYFQLEDSLYVYYIYPEPGSNDWLGFKEIVVTMTGKRRVEGVLGMKGDFKDFDEAMTNLVALKETLSQKYGISFMGDMEPRTMGNLRSLSVTGMGAGDETVSLNATLWRKEGEDKPKSRRCSV